MNRYSKEVRDYIQKNVVGTTTKELVELVNTKFGTDFTDSKMKAYKSNNKLKSGTPNGLPAGRPTELYPEEIRKFIESNHHNTGPKGMAELLNKTFGTSYTSEQLKSYYGNNNIDSGLNGQFHKGLVPANKGIKGNIYEGCKNTWFKKGHIPKNHKPVGSERINVDGYTEVKIAEPNRWRLKQQLIYEKNNGPIPEGYAVIFGDGDKGNFDINNLLLVSRLQLLILNRYKLIQNDTNLTRTAIIIADLHQKISERKVKIDDK